MPDNELIAEQLRHALDLIKSENELLKKQQQHDAEVYRLRLDVLEAWKADAETRIRSMQEGVTQFKVLAGLATGGGLLSLAALVKMLAG
jgi:hypothetical protein